MELAIDEKDFDYFNAFEEPYMPPRKRQQLSEAAMERKRAENANESSEDSMEVNV
jgi:hypothetical protein